MTAHFGPSLAGVAYDPPPFEAGYTLVLDSFVTASIPEPAGFGAYLALAVAIYCTVKRRRGLTSSIRLQ